MSTNLENFSAYLDAAKQQKNTPEQVLARQQQVFERDIAPKLPKEKVEQARQQWQSLTTPLIEKAGFIKFDQPDPKVLNTKQYADNLNKFYQSGIGLDAAKQKAYEQTKRDLTPDKGILGYGRDIALSALRGAISVPEAAVGLIDIPTGGRIGKFLENEGGIIGFRPEEAKAVLDDLHTDKYKLQQQDFANAPGLMGKLRVVADNPSLVVNPVVESLPLMGAGGVIGRGIMAAAPRVSGLAAGAAGEGTVSAGIQAEQIRSQTDDGHLSGKQSLLAATTGGVTGALSLGGAGLARRFGVADVDTMLASGMGSTAAMANKGIARRVAEGAVTEGLLEELPQSVSEQMQQNAALDKPLDQGVMDNAIIGTLSGAAMGGGFAGYAGMQRNSQVKQIKQAQTSLPAALSQAQTELQAAQQAGDPTGLQAAQQQYDVVLEAVNATNAKATEYGINSHTPEFKGILDSLGLSNPADPQPGDIGRVSDGQPFANKNAALNYQKKNGLADTHEIVRLGASPQFVLRDKNPAQPEPEPEQAQQELLGLPAPVYEVTPDGTVITTADRNAQVQQQHQDEADRLDRINRGEMRDVTPIPVSDTPIQPPTPGLAGVAERALQRDAEVSARKEVDFKELYRRARLNGDNETANQAIQDAFTSGIELPVLQQWRRDVEPEIQAQQEQAYQNYLGQQPQQTPQSPIVEPQQQTPTDLTVDQPPTPNTTADDIRNGMNAISQGMQEGARDQVADYIRNGQTERVTYRKPDAIEAARQNPDYNVQDNEDGSVTVVGVRDSQGNWQGMSPENTVSEVETTARIDDQQVPSIEPIQMSNPDQTVPVEAPAEKIESPVTELEPVSVAVPVIENTSSADTNTRQPTDIGRVSDGQPFASKSAAVKHQRKNNLTDSHEVVQIGKSQRFVLRPKQPQKNLDTALQEAASTNPVSTLTAPNGIKVGDRVVVNNEQNIGTPRSAEPMVGTVKEIQLNAPLAYGGTAFKVARDDATPDGRGTGWYGIHRVSLVPDSPPETMQPNVAEGLNFNQKDITKALKPYGFKEVGDGLWHLNDSEGLAYKVEPTLDNKGLMLQSIESGQAFDEIRVDYSQVKSLNEIGREFADFISKNDERFPLLTKPEKAKGDKQDTGVESAPESAKTAITDFGEKIGGARKDTAVSGSGNARRKKAEDNRPSWARRYEVSQTVASDTPSEVGRWVIRDTKKTNWLGHPVQKGGSFATQEEAENAIPLVAVGHKHRVVPQHGDAPGFEIWRNINDNKRVKVVDEVFTTRQEALEYMATHAQAILETNTTFGEADLPRPDNTIRTGLSRRTDSAKDSDFMQTFGFRGVEFGNWNSQTERQQLLDDAYDGLLDLAEILNIPPKAISLNGELALAFGARGQGLSGARAHYEPSKAVINLTKMNGAGSLAHEWFHALDHYLARQDGKAAAQWVTIKDGTRSLKASNDFRSDSASGGFSRGKSGVREELRTAYNSLMQTMTTKAETFVSDTVEADSFVARSRDDVAGRIDAIRKELMAQKDPAYYKRHNKPASTDQIAEFDAFAQQIIDGTALETEWRSTGAKTRNALSGMRWTNDALEKLSAIYKAVRGRTGFNSEQTGELDKLRAVMGRYSARLKMLAEAQTGTEKVRKIPTQFAMDAKELDQGRGSDYWTTPHEMAARAFQGFIEDKVQESGGYSPFLNFGPESASILTPWGWKRPFPHGEERRAINKAFQNLVDILQTKETDQGTALFSRLDDIQSDMSPSKFTPADTRQILTDRFGEDTISKLEQSGKLEIVESLDSLPQDAFNSITAYHGSPYKFDKFSLEHLGRGEGAQLFGYGLYFADNKAVGDFYRKNLSKDGQLYQVDIDAEKLLQWELPLSKQAEQEALASIKQQLDDAGLLEHYEELIGRKFDSWTGAILHTVLKNAASNQQLPDNNNLDVMEAQEYQKPDKAVSMYLNSHGIDGIRYLDRGSRDGTTGTVSNNYVIFDDSAIQITQTYYSQNPGGIEGYHHNGKTVLVASNLTADTVIPTFLHEVGGHAGLQGILPAKTYDALMSQFDAMVKAGNPLAVEAKRRAEVESDPDTQRSEYLPYLITVASQAQNKRSGPFQAVQRMIQRIVSAVKAWAIDKLGVNLKITPDDIVALAERMVQRVAGTENVDSSPRASKRDVIELPAFKRWFGNSKVVNNEGRPLVMYHGTNKANADGSDFTMFDTYASAHGLMGQGSYFTDNKAVAQSYTTKGKGSSPRVYETYLSITKPLDMDAVANPEQWKAQFSDAAEQGYFDRMAKNTNEAYYRQAEEYFADEQFYRDEAAEMLVSGIEEMGYDGVTHIGGGRMKADSVKHRVYIIFHPGQVKSATSNNGSFDATNPDIRFSRTPWQPDFPDAVVLHRADEVQSHPDYKAAKAGDTAAAGRLVRDVVTEADLAKLKKLVGDTTDLVVAVHAEEQSGRNKIPVAFATLIEQKLGIEADLSIVQAKKVNRGGADGVARLIKTVPFSGNVEAGKRYLLVDDTLTQGGTLASLKGYIEENGGDVVGASTLMGKQYSAKMALQPDTLANLQKIAGKDFEQWWNEALGYSFSELTESEARYLTTLIRKSDANTIRDRLIAEGQAGSDNSTTPAVPGSPVTGKPRFSRQSPPANGPQQASQFDAISQQAMYQWQLQSGKMAKVPKHIGKFLGTMLHKALTNPEFKKPFDLIQAKINHLSVEAYDSLRQAPEVLGHMEDWKDFKREASNLLPKNFKARKADFAKVSDAVFNGTLNDKKVYSVAELRAMGMKDNQIGIYHDIRNAIDTSLDHYARSVMSKIVQAAGVPMNEIMALHNRDLPVFAHQLELERLADRYAGTDGQDVMANAKERITEVMEKLGKLKEEGYAPLMRFGDHYLKITDPNQKTSDNPDGTVLRQHYESETERDLVARRLQQSLPAGHQLETGSLNPDDYKMFAGVSPETVALFIKESGLPMDDVTQQYLKLATAQHSALRRLIHRKGIEGFSDDVQRVLAAFVMSNARYSANRLFNDQIDQAVMDVKDGELRQQAQKMRDYALDPKEEMRGVKNFMFLYYMGGSVMFGLINMTQPIMQTFPHLTRYAGGAAFGHIMRGLKQAMQSLKTNTPPATYQANYEKAQREGHLDPQNVWMLQGLERGKVGLANSGWQVFSHAMGYIASVTETINRRATLFAALDTAKKMGAAKLANLGFASEYDFAIRAIQETQGIYNKGNRPRMARGNVGSLLMMYKQFGIAYIEQMIRATNDPMWAGERDDKRKALLLMLALLFTTAGLTGLPFAKDLMDLIETGTGIAGKPMNLERETQLFLRERMGDEFGQTVADGLMYGPFNFNPVVDIQGRTNMGNQLPGTGAFKMTNDSFETSRQLTEIGGATGGLLQNMYNSMMFLQRGKSEEAMAALAPKAIADAYKGAKGVATGQLMNERGDKVTDLSMAESLVKVFGGQPARVADEGRTRGYEQKDKQIKNAMSRYFRQRLEDAYNDGGADDVKSVREDIKKWNADNSRYPINIRDSDIKKRVKNSNSTWQERNKTPKGMEWMEDLRPE